MVVWMAKHRSLSCSIPILGIASIFLTFSLGILTAPANVQTTILNQIWGTDISFYRGNWSQRITNLGISYRNTSEGIGRTASKSSAGGLVIPGVDSEVVPGPIDLRKRNVPEPSFSKWETTSKRKSNERAKLSSPLNDERGRLQQGASSFSGRDQSEKILFNLSVESRPSKIKKEERRNRLKDNQAGHFPSSTISSGKCNLFNGSWIPDPQGPLYRNDSCPVLSQPQNCQFNGRPDRDYENWRWQPRDCTLQRFDAHAFFRIMKGKTLAFVGDSVARNQMESLMCILWQVEPPKNIGNRKMQRWFFRSHSVTIIRIWSAWLVHTSTAAFQFAPENLTKLHLEQPDESFMEMIPRFDVLVVSSGHWMTKKSAYILKGELAGGQLWWNHRYPQKVESEDAFVITLRTSLRAIVSHPDYNGLTILRTYSPDHYEHGAWNTGGSCTGKTRPLKETEVVSNVYTQLMRRHQLDIFKEVEHNITNASKLRLMDITPVFDSRADGHPGPYRTPDPHKITKRGPKGQPPPQDCLHWCMPGPIDTWNEFLLEFLRQELDSSMTTSV